MAASGRIAIGAAVRIAAARVAPAVAGRIGEAAGIAVRDSGPNAAGAAAAVPARIGIGTAVGVAALEGLRLSADGQQSAADDGSAGDLGQKRAAVELARRLHREISPYSVRGLFSLRPNRHNMNFCGDKARMSCANDGARGILYQAGMADPDAAATARFRADLDRLGLGAARPFGVAVSGGPDSLALLLLANAAFPGLIHAATVDHGLRAESADEAETVAAICARMGVPHAILSAGMVATSNVQAAARARRYDLLAWWAEENGLACILTAHHLDDQAETLLMRLLRGSGLAGLAGIRARQDRPVPVLRPLLGWRRAELEVIVLAAGN